jgi:hypothetical protein
MSELHTARQERAAAAKAAAAAAAPASASDTAGDPAQAGGRRSRSERLASSRRLSRPAARRELPGKGEAEPGADDLPALPHSPEERKKRLDTSKTSPKAVA